MQQSLHDLACREQPQCGGRVVPAERIHLTLAFLGAVPLAQWDSLITLAAALPPPEARLTLDCLGYWRGPQVVWAGARLSHDGLARWVSGLTVALRQSGFRTETRAFVPHVTLLRKARRAPLSTTMESIEWPISAFSLVESLTTADGPVYRTRQRWPG